MPFVINKILLSLGFILLLTLFIGTRTGLAIDVAYPDRFQVNDDRHSDDYIHYMAKRRFLPTRRELHRYINEDFSSDNDEADSHLKSKRYFLKSKRYFLNSKREDVRFSFRIKIIFIRFIGIIRRRKNSNLDQE
jgi:hypothetical protein